MVEIPVQLTHVNGKTESARILNYTPITLGTQKEKGFIDIVRENTEGISHMVQRKVEYPPQYKGDKSSAQHYMDLWSSLRQANIPTLDEVVVISENVVAETNLAADGSRVYGKDTGNNDIVPSPVDEIFKALDMKEVFDEAMRVAKLAADSHIMLSQDHCLDLVVHPDGTWVVMARDIKHTFTNVQYPVDAKNIENAERFVNIHLMRTKGKLQ